MSYFPDVNIWIAIAAAGHLHHRTAKEWFDSIDDPIVFSRVTQMGFLRLLTNPKVMGGEVLSPEHAWVLAAFASTANLNLVTFDRDFRKYPGLSLTILKND